MAEEEGALGGRLHNEILDWAQAAAPGAGEVRRKEAALSQLRAACTMAFGQRPGMRVEAFGSHVHGMSLAGCDVDVVITGLLTPRNPRAGLEPDERETARIRLRQLANLMARRQVAARRPLVINSRIPIIKQAEVGGVRVDVSIYTDDGPRAARWLLQQQAAWPCLRPLVMAVKALLVQADLLDPSRGGMSTWAVSNMAVGLLLKRQREGLACDDCGDLLLHFLRFFGGEFDYEGQAVAAARGGVVPKADVPGAREVLQGGDEARKQRLCVEDPLTGKDVANLSTAIDRVAATLSEAAAKLQRLLQAPPANAILAELLPGAARATQPPAAGRPAAAAKPVSGAKRPAPGVAGNKPHKKVAVEFRPRPKGF